MDTKKKRGLGSGNLVISDACMQSSYIYTTQKLVVQINLSGKRSFGKDPQDKLTREH